MVKEKVGRTSFLDNFWIVKAFSGKMDYDEVKHIGQIHNTDEEFQQGALLRYQRRLPKGVSPVSVSCVRPKQKGIPLGQALFLAMDYGFMPATHHETVLTLNRAVSEQIHELFVLANQVVNEGKTKDDRYQMVTSVSVVSFGTAVLGRTGELIPVQEVRQFGGGSCRSHLRKLDLKAPIPPAQMLALVSA